MSIARCHNTAHFRDLARRRLPAAMFHYIDGGADDEFSLRRNTDAFEKYQLMPRAMVDISQIDMRTKLFGKTLDWPVFMAPTGMNRLFHHDKELGAARAAAKAGTMYTLSTLATTSLEDVAKASDGPKMFQIYILKDRGLTTEFVERCKAAKYDALCLTVDMPVAGNRERDKLTGMTMPPRFGIKGLFNFAMHPAWSLNFLLNPNFMLANVAHRVDALGAGAMSVIAYANSQFDRTVTWEDVAWLAKQWNGPLSIKGIVSAEDAKCARDAGATSIMISNHGGRQLDGAPAPIDCVAPMRDAIGDSMELIVDGGIRRGTHVIKALAMGANACSIGRGYLYALAAGGEAGVSRALTLMKAEVERDMALMGCANIASITRKCLDDGLKNSL
jgi:L-lactate dehydrogenase (cytochrome)